MSSLLCDPTYRRSNLIGAVLAAGICGYLATGNAAEAQAIQAAGPELTRLLRGMALIKALMAAIMAAAVFWRLQFPIPPVRLAAYITACAAMAAGPFLVWDMAHIIGGAVLLHAGLLAAVLLGWRDETWPARPSWAACCAPRPCGGQPVCRETGKALELQVFYDDDVTIHISHGPRVIFREEHGEASAGASAGWP